MVILPLGHNMIPSPFDAISHSEELIKTLDYIPFTNILSSGTGWQRLGQGVSQLLIALQATIFAFALRNRFRR